jgi:surface protein
MSCNNTNSTCTNCNHNYSSCNNKCAKCGCKDSFLTSPPPCPTPNGCPDPVPCQEVLSSDCVIYTGDPIMCDDIVIIPSDSTMTEALIALADFMCGCCGVPPPVTSYNCTSGSCVLVAGPGGTYPTLAACTAACTSPVTSYNCTNGTCVLVSGSGGQYPTLALCQNACTPPVTTYNCTNGNCVSVSGSGGQYATLAACTNACIITYNCIDGDCVPVDGDTGQYTSLFVCEAFCEPPPCENTIFMTFNRIAGPWLCDYEGCTEVGVGLGYIETEYICEVVSSSNCDFPVGTWNCIDGACVDPGDGTGTYDFYNACWFGCVNPIPPTERDVYTMYSYYDCLPAVPFTYNCVNGTCQSVTGSGGTYATLAACTLGCTPLPTTSYNCVSGNCVAVSGSGGTYSTLPACLSNCMPPAPCENTIFMTFEALYNPSWNCIGTSCIDPGDGSGTYSTLSACTTACTPPSVTSYNCNAGNCLQVIGTGGTYATLLACQAACIPPAPLTWDISFTCSNNPPNPTVCNINLTGGVSPYCFGTQAFTTQAAALANTLWMPCADPVSACYGLNNGTWWVVLKDATGTLYTQSINANCLPSVPTYNCVSGNCIDPLDGSGTYPSLLTCTNACSSLPPLSFNCLNGACTNPGDGSGTYSSLAACTAVCTTPPQISYNCVNGVCADPLNGSGIYPTLLACTAVCTTPPQISYNCFLGNCTDPGDGSGLYPTLGLCTAACTPPVTTYNCINCLCNSVSGPGGTYATLGDCVSSGCNDTFTTTWETTTAGESITLPYYAAGVYSGTIDWGDSTTSANSFATSTHIYATPGIYTVTICGRIAGWNFSTTPVSATKIKSVVTWGQLTLGNDIGGYFTECHNLDLSSVTDTLDLFGTGITDMSFMFARCFSLTTINNINFWDTSAITNMNSMFANCILFNQPLSFNTSAVTNMSFMFGSCSVFNQSLSFNTLLVTDMSGMFASCLVFNSALTFNTSAVMYMSGMFNNCSVFNQALSFNTSAVINMSAMFAFCSAFNQPINFNTSAVTDMSSMFFYATSFNQPLTFNTSLVTNMNSMFGQCTVFNQPLTFTSTALVQNMYAMFANSPAFQQDISSWNIQNVTDFTNFMLGKTPATWSQLNFDNLLCQWSLQTVNPNLIIDFGSANYTNATGGPCYTILDTAPNNWTIISGGGV